MMPDLATRLTPDEIAEKLATHAGMVWKIAIDLHAKNRNLSLEDIHGAVQLGFVRAASMFDPSKGLQFGTYAYPAGWREGVIYCHAEQAGGFHVPMSHPCWKCPAMAGVHPWIADRHRSDDPATVRFPSDFWEHATRDLAPPDKRVILRMFRDGKTQTEVASELGVSKARAQQIHARAMLRIRSRAEELKVYLGAA